MAEHRHIDIRDEHEEAEPDEFRHKVIEIIGPDGRTMRYHLFRSPDARPRT
ncbi:hypothetical protein [Nocardia paucivorans]|uniref:hypothetical protein n=1 Tax=Nocardia paucivorans TaxID=114259 RepID=UPI0002FF8700|nr:hypothetical protein [Nocardia paucivorans]